MTTAIARVYDDYNESNKILRRGDYLKHLITKAVCSSTRKFIPVSMASHSRKKGQSESFSAKPQISLFIGFLIMGCTTV
jgi:hypothetical protein